MRLDHLLSKENKELLKIYCLFFNVLFSTLNFYGGVAQLARAPALQAGGQEFDSPHLHHPKKNFRKQHIEKYIDISNKVN